MSIQLNARSSAANNTKYQKSKCAAQQPLDEALIPKAPFSEVQRWQLHANRTEHFCCVASHRGAACAALLGLDMLQSSSRLGCDLGGHIHHARGQCASALCCRCALSAACWAVSAHFQALISRVQGCLRRLIIRQLEQLSCHCQSFPCAAQETLVWSTHVGSGRAYRTWNALRTHLRGPRAGLHRHWAARGRIPPSPSRAPPRVSWAPHRPSSQPCQRTPRRCCCWTGQTSPPSPWLCPSRQWGVVWGCETRSPGVFCTCRVS